ncbi:hypothetical protein HCN51_57470 [Nonomuraea sp. FMUSA5-5]|uniref:Uncharacterized protein n=1 Tax=Nonomuraea composti TaxID=2720023 RepID=A0ABX1BW25_9ACTN|nr:hypothetical protein [Nonomuraea sp. FMUSA5-5]NJP98908.1 hypothetical protein [Nonomuraea sp. FMUSA5-5]
MPGEPVASDPQGASATHVRGAIAALEQLILGLAPDDPDLPGLAVQLHNVMGVMLRIEHATSLSASGAREDLPDQRGQSEHGGRCPVCTGPIRRAYTGRPAHYCTKICRQRAHRIRHRAARIAARLERERQGFSDTVALLAPLLVQLQELDQRVREQPTDRRCLDEFVATGWEPDSVEVAHEMQRHLATITAAARKHRAGVDDLHRAQAAERTTG